MSVDTQITVVSHPRYCRHDTGGGGHPEVPDRLRVIMERLAAELFADRDLVLARPAGRELLLAVHSESYLYRFEEAALSGRTWLGHPDNQMGYDTYDIARLAAGAGPTGVDLLEQRRAGMVFCLVRPPGHHAERSVPLGFCFLNNCAVAARYWQRQYGREKILILDFDAHHGNGIQAAFEEDSSIFYLSIHEHPTFSFPGTGFAGENGSGAGIGTTLNIPLPPGAGDEMVIKAFERKIEPAVAWFRPEALVVAAGFDGHRADDMSGLAYSSELYGYLGRRLGALAERFCQGRLLTILEGGYHLESLARGAGNYCLGAVDR